MQKYVIFAKKKKKKKKKTKKNQWVLKTGKIMINILSLKN